MFYYKYFQQCPYCGRDLIYNTSINYWICPNGNCESKDVIIACTSDTLTLENKNLNNNEEEK